MKKDENTLKRVLTGTLFGTATAAGASLILVLLGTLVLTLLPDPQGYIFPIGVVILYLSSLGGGILASVKGEGLVAPLISGGLLAVIILLVSCLLPGKATLSPLPLVIAYTAIPLAFLAGGLLCRFAANGTKGRKKRKKRR